MSKHRGSGIAYPWQQADPSKPSAAVPDPPRPKVQAEPIPRLAISIPELAAALSVSTGTVQGWLRNGTAPPHIRTPEGRRILFPVKAVELWLLDCAEGGAK
jgi:excisionase family DNA binding protein